GPEEAGARARELDRSADGSTRIAEAGEGAQVHVGGRGDGEADGEVAVTVGESAAREGGADAREPPGDGDGGGEQLRVLMLAGEPAGGVVGVGGGVEDGEIAGGDGLAARVDFRFD